MLQISAFFQPGACGPEWTIKDTMNHILVWQEAALRILPMLARGEKAALGMGTERFNGQEYLRHKDVSLDETLRNLIATLRKLLDLVATLPESQMLTEPGRIKASSSRFRSRKLGQCHHLMKVLRSSPSRSWAACIVTIAEVPELFQR
jgi:hypothetical protein